jgi:hypothetical protein
MKKIILLTMLFMLSSLISYAQDDVQIGKSLRQFGEYKGAQYDYSDADAINIKVIVWGYVQFPGQYIIPSTSSVNDLLALAGGPLPDANIEDLRLFKTYSDSSQDMVKFNYNDLLWNDKLSSKINIPKLNAGDILLVPGSPRWFLRDYLGLTLSIITTLTSIAVLLITIFK